MPGVQHQAPQGFQRCSESEKRRYSTTRRYGNPRDAKRLWTAYKTRDSEPCWVKQESPTFRRGEVQNHSSNDSDRAIVREDQPRAADRGGAGRWLSRAADRVSNHPAA